MKQRSDVRTRLWAGACLVILITLLLSASIMWATQTVPGVRWLDGLLTQLPQLQSPQRLACSNRALL
jgi:hypothetical protein